jgi:hypothetical protein
MIASKRYALSVKSKLVVQIYVQMPETNIGRRPLLKELKSFRKLSLESGEGKVISFVLGQVQH